MIIGSGLIANAFKMYENSKDVLIFASGVSNSAEQSDKAFEREICLLKTYIDTNTKLIYFGTTSIYDEDLKHSKYIKHKLYIENLITTSFKNYIIFRLPTVIGNTSNNNTFFNGIKNKLTIDGSVTIKQNAIRYIIDVDDLTYTLNSIIPKENKISINVCFNNKSSVKDLVKIMADILELSYNELLIDAGYDYTIDNSYFLKYVTNNSIGLTKNYNYITLKKYLI
jgi:nucleoside-diphosphate-sugar epimerase